MRSKNRCKGGVIGEAADRFWIKAWPLSMASSRIAVLLALLVMCASCATFTPTLPVLDVLEPRRGFPEGLTITAISIPSSPWALRCGEGGIWLVETGFIEPNFWRIDPESAALTPVAISVPQPPLIALGHGSLWISASGVQNARAAYRVNPATLERVAVIPAKGRPIIGSEFVWLVYGFGGEVARVDPRTNAITGTIDTDQDLYEAVESEGTLWVLGLFSGQLLRIDPAACRITGTIRVGPELAKWYSLERMQEGPRWNHAYAGLAAGLGSLWVIDVGARELIRVNPETGAVIGKPELIGTPICMTVWRDSLWVACDAGSRAAIHRIDATGTTVGTIALPLSVRPSFQIDATEDALWFAQPSWAYRIRLGTGARPTTPNEPVTLSP